MAKIYSIILSFFVFTPVLVFGANLSVSPSGGTYEVGERVSIRIIATSDVLFNAISGDILFPTSIFSIESVSKTSSILNFWVTEPTVLKNVGTVKFEGVSLGGFQGNTGTVITVTLRANNVGTGKISIRAGQILANDGQGTDITGDLLGGTYVVKEATKATPIENPIIEEEIVQPKPTLKAPEIMRGQKYGTPAIVGSSDYPKAQVLLTFVSQSGGKIFINGTSDSDGSFSVVIPNSLKRGVYNVTAVMIKEDKTNSQVSNMIIIQIGDLFSDLSWEIWLILLILILLIIYLLLRIYFHFKKDKNLRKNIKHEAEEAQKIVHKSFDILKEDISSYEEERTNANSHKMVLGIKKDINEAEKAINKEIKDIESS